MGSSGPANILVSIGTIFLSFGLVFMIIEFLAMSFGTSRSLGVTLGVAFLLIGALIAGGGVFMNRSHARRTRV
jgi:hypothetical protein